MQSRGINVDGGFICDTHLVNTAKATAGSYLGIPYCRVMFITTTGSGTRGRPMKSWNDYVRDDLVALGHAYDWWRKCKDREQMENKISGVAHIRSP